MVLTKIKERVDCFLPFTNLDASSNSIFVQSVDCAPFGAPKVEIRRGTCRRSYSSRIPEEIASSMNSWPQQNFDIVDLQMSRYPTLSVLAGGVSCAAYRLPQSCSASPS